MARGVRATSVLACLGEARSQWFFASEFRNDGEILVSWLTWNMSFAKGRDKRTDWHVHSL